jgi:hypothetical protein
MEKWYIPCIWASFGNSDIFIEGSICPKNFRCGIAYKMEMRGFA